MSLRDWTLRLRALIRPGRVERELQDELQFHVERETRKLIDEGLTAEEARIKAHARLGSITVAADACRDERGTAFIDNSIGDILYALRTFKRAPLAAITIVTTVAIGLGVVAVLYTILNLMLFRVDAVPGVADMYGVEHPRLANDEQSPLTRPQFEALRTETHVFTDAYAEMADIDLRVDGRMMSVTLVSGNFFDVVGVHPVMGRALTPSDDLRSGGNPVIVLSDKGFDRRFNRDPNVLGQTVLVNGAPFQIVGVMPGGFRGLAVGAPDFWAPLSTLAQFRPIHAGHEDAVGVGIVGRLRPGVSVESARAQLSAWDSNQQAPTTERKGESIVLRPRRGTVPQPLEAIALFAPLFVAFGLILMIGCANVANLLLARGVARQREIGIRLSLGASRRRIIRQLLTESVLLSLAAAALGYVISRFALEGTVYWALREMPTDLGDVNLNVPAADWRVAVFLVFASMVATAFFALMPALQATRIDPVRTLRGELVKDAKPGRARNILIGVQVFASALLLICSAVFLRSAIASSQYDPGLRTADTMVIDIINEQKRVGMLEAIASDSTVTMFGAVRPDMLARPLEAMAEVGSSRTQITYKFVSPEYFDVFAVPILRGRNFTAAERDGNHPVVIVSEPMAKALWPNGSGIGETFRLDPLSTSSPGGGGATINPDRQEDVPQMPARIVTVVGVSREVPGFRFVDVDDPGMFLPVSINGPKTAIVARFTGDAEIARRAVVDHLTKVDPNMGMVITMKTVARLETFFLQIAFWVSLILGGLALLLTVTGLFSVLSYLVEQRTKEIGLRMALGATSQRVTQLMLAQTTRPVIYGLIAGTALALSLATLVLATPVGATMADIVHVTDPVAYIGSLLLIVIACLLAAWIPARSAARVDPMKTLRQE